MNISKISAIEVLDSRGNPTVKAYVELENGVVGSAIAPSGASTGTHEALELRDNDSKRYLGKGVLHAVQNVNTLIHNELKGKAIDNLKEIDQKMLVIDGTDNKSKLGANAILAVSLACARAFAYEQKKPLWQVLNTYYFENKTAAFPRLFVNIVNGGKHANWNFDIQEFIISPTSTKPSESIKISSEIFHILGKNLKKKGLSTLVGDEGGYSPMLSSNNEVFEYCLDAIKDAGYENHITLAIDAAASEFYEGGKYILKKQNKTLSTTELVDYYMSLAEKYGVFSFEDVFDEDDWDGFMQLTSRLDGKALVVGDDLYATNPKRIKTGIEKKASTAVLIKINQIGSLLETVEAIKLCNANGLKTAISHRSGETEDTFIADLAVACGADFIKTGSMCRSDRIAKYNRLIEIEKNEI